MFYHCAGRLAMVLMVAGFMENDEDDKRSFGVLPDELSLKERLTRYYSIHAPDRLEKVDSEVLCFEDDPQQLFDHVSGLCEYLLSPIDATDNKSHCLCLSVCSYAMAVAELSVWKGPFESRQLCGASPCLPI